VTKKSNHKKVLQLNSKKDATRKQTENQQIYVHLNNDHQKNMEASVILSLQIISLSSRNHCRKNWITIRANFTTNRRTVAGVRIMHVKYKTHIFTIVLLHKYQYLAICKWLFSSNSHCTTKYTFNYMFLCNILNSSSGIYNNRSALTQEWTYVYSSKTSKYVGSSVHSGVNADLLL